MSCTITAAYLWLVGEISMLSLMLTEDDGSVANVPLGNLANGKHRRERRKQCEAEEHVERSQYPDRRGCRNGSYIQEFTANLSVGSRRGASEFQTPVLVLFLFAVTTTEADVPLPQHNTEMVTTSPFIQTPCESAVTADALTDDDGRNWHCGSALTAAPLQPRTEQPAARRACAAPLQRDVTPCERWGAGAACHTLRNSDLKVRETRGGFSN